MTESNIIEKIKKLFALGQVGKNNSEAEAASAMARAQELLAKYNLDIRTIQDAAQETSTGKREKVKVNHSAMYRWQQALWKVIAETNFCFHWVVNTQEPRYGRTVRCKRHVILGSQANVTVAQMMGTYLAETIERLIPYTGTERLSNAAISWREGCAERLIERIQERAERMKAEGFKSEGASCTALAVQDLHEKEYAANYDAHYGAGAYARMKQRNAEWEAGQAKREAEAQARENKQAEERARTLAGETPEQRAKREKQEAKAAGKQAAKDARWWAAYQRRQYREAARRDVAAYARGSKAGSNINLDAQLDSKDKGQLR